MTPAVVQRLERIEYHLTEIQRDIAEGVQRIRDNFPNDAEVAAAVDYFIAETLEAK